MRKFWAFYALINMLFLAIALVLGFAGQTAAAPGENGQNQEVFFAQFDGSMNPHEVFDRVNAKRTDNNLLPLLADKKLSELAAARAKDLADRKYYAHKSPDGKYYYDYFDQYNIRSGYSCENLDLIFQPDEQQVIHEWMASLKGHRGCLLHNQVTHAGYATTKIRFVNPNGVDIEAHVVVALHARSLD